MQVESKMPETFSIDAFTNILIDSLSEVTTQMKNNPGIISIIKKKLSFEKWFQTQLLERLLHRTYIYEGIEILNEEGSEEKIGKKGETIDLAVLLNGQKFIGIELTLSPTSYKVTGFVTKGKCVSDKSKKIVSDIIKSKRNGYEYQFSLGLFYPFPKDLTHRNHRDFNKQIRVMKRGGHLICIDCPISDDFLARYYILSNHQFN